MFPIANKRKESIQSNTHANSTNADNMEKNIQKYAKTKKG